MQKPESNFTDFNRIFSEAVKETTVTVPSHLFKLLYAHWTLLTEWNRKINLTGITDLREAVARHYIDSLALLPAIENAGGVLDVGSGAGFPGIVLALACEKLPITLVESIEKKAHFLMEIRRSLAVENVTVINKRVEDIEAGNRFDLVTGRAAAKPKQFAQIIRDRITHNGRMAIFIKGFDPPELTGWNVEKSYEYRLPYGGEKRSVVTYRPK